jgi:hypothetical protein
MVKKAKSNWKSLIGPGLLVGAIIGSIVFLYLDRTRTHQYVCHIEGFDPESGMIGMECMYR